MKRVILTLSLISTALLIPNPHNSGKAQNTVNRAQSQRGIVTEAKVSPKILVKLDSVSATTSDNQLALKYSVANQTGSYLTRFEMVALVVGADGGIKGGEVWAVNDILKANSAREFWRLMKTQVEAGDGLILTVSLLRGDFGTIQLDKVELDNALGLPANSLKQLSNVRHVEAIVADYCMGWYEYAASKCACGVKSYSCDPKNGTVSWSCFSKSEMPDGCGGTVSD